MVTKVSFLAYIFIVWLSVFSLCGNADEKVDTQSQSAAKNVDDVNIPGWPVIIGGGGDSNGGGGDIRIWTPIGWIVIHGWGNSHGGGGGGGLVPGGGGGGGGGGGLVPGGGGGGGGLFPGGGGGGGGLVPGGGGLVSPPAPKPTPPKSTTPSKPKPLVPSTSTPAKPKPPVIPPWLAPFIPPSGGQHSSPATPSNPKPKVAPWLAPFVPSGGKGSPPHAATTTTNVMTTQSVAAAGGLETSKTSDHQYKCWSPLMKIDKCVNEIFTAFLSRRSQVIGSDCCSAIKRMNKDCHANTIGNFNDHFFATSVHKQCSAN